MITHHRYERPEPMANKLQKAGCGMMATGCLICVLVPFMLVAAVVVAGMM